MPTHNSPRWRAENEGREDLLAVEIAKRRARRGYSWEVDYEERRWRDDLIESLLGPERARAEGRRKRRTPQRLPDLPPGGPIVSLKIRPLSGEDDT